MKDIDFLPTRYRERSVQRRARLLRLAVVCCLGGVVVVLSLAQQAVRRSVDRELSTVTAQFDVAKAESLRVESLRQSLTECDAFASLYTYLQHPWPVTQLLTGVAEILPDSIVISQIKMESTVIPNSNSAPESPAATPPTNLTEAAIRDLDRLRTSQDATAYTLQIRGVTSNAAELQKFVKRLAPSPLFRAAKLESLEAQKSDDGAIKSQFELRIFVRAGFGQAGGPQQPMLPSSRDTVVVSPRSDTPRNETITP